MKPDQCPRYQTCNAPVCPLDMTPTVHLGGEPVCYYLRASVKAGADDRFRDDPVFAECKGRLPAIAETYPDIRRTLDRAARSGFRGGNLVQNAAVDGTLDPSDTRVMVAG